MSYSDFAKRINELKRQYNLLIEESKLNGDYSSCTVEAIDKYVFQPYSHLCKIYMEDPNTPMTDLEIPSDLVSSCNIGLRQFFDFLKTLSPEQISHYAFKVKIDMLFREEIMESIEDGDYDRFYAIAKGSRHDFETFMGIFKLLYQAESTKESVSEEESFDDDEDFYQYIKSELIGNLNSSFFQIPDYTTDESLTYVKEFFQDAIDHATKTFPSKDLFEKEDYFVRWHIDEYFYCQYLRFFIDTLFVDFGSLCSRILWHPATIKYKLKWSKINLLLPKENLTIKDGFFSKPINLCDDHFNCLRPEFVDAGELALEMLLDICPFRDDASAYDRIFAYRITGRGRSNQEELPVNLFFPDSAPYIYYLIKGIMEPTQSEDIYGKMKTFFSTVDFPDNEEDIPEPCDSWKEALAELYPTIFGDSESQSYLSLDRPDCMYQKELAEIGDIFFPGQNFHLLFSTPPTLTEPLKWNKSWDELNYLLRVIYTGQVVDDEICNTGGKIKQWEEIHRCFVKNGDYPNKLQFTGWGKLQSLLKNRYIEIDNKLKPILQRVRRSKNG